MHAFFDGYVNSKTTLKQFVEQYENALHNKVEKEKLADFACFNSRVPCKNRYEFEKQFQDAFTIDKFKEFLDEFAGKIYCGLSSVKENIALAEFLVYEDVKVWECSKHVIFKVILNEEANEVKCNCRLFEFRGILCWHIILVLIEKQIFRISEKYIFRRWRKDVKRCHTKVKVSYADWSSKPEAHRFEKMCNLFYEVADMATKSDEKCNMVMGLVNDLKLKLTSNEVVSESNQHETNVIDGATQVDKFEDTSNGGCKILSPRVVRGKGRPPSKRLQSKVEKVIQKRKAKNIQMKSNEKKLEKDFGRTKGLGNAFEAKDNIVPTLYKPRENQSSFDTYMHIEKFPEGIKKYITHQTEVLPDGNCGYRIIAMAMRFGHNEWRRVRKDLLQQLQDMSSIFKKCIREHKRYNEIERALNYFDDEFAPFFYWMTMPDMGHIIATCYNVVLILLSMRQCLTFLHFSVQSSETKLREIAIGFVDDDHYVQVHLSPDHPIPPVSRMWHEQSDICNVTHLYSRYQARVDAFQQLPGVENVATTDTVILMTDENAPTTELRL